MKMCASSRERGLTPLTGLVVGLLCGAAAAAPVGADAEPAFKLVKAGTHYTISGEFYRVVWDAGRGGEIVGVEVHDGIRWRSVLPGGRQGRSGIPGLTIKSEGETYALARDAKGQCRIVKESPEQIELEFSGTPRAADGTGAGISAKQSFTVYREGVVSCDLELQFAKAQTVSVARLGLVLDNGAEPTMRRDHVGRHGLILWSKDQPKWEPIKKARYTDPYVLFSLADGKTHRPWTNHVDFWLEGRDAIGGGRYVHRSKVAQSSGVGYAWDLTGEGPVKVAAGSVYRNRWGIGLGRARTTGKLIGARIYHWIGRDSSKLFYPTDDALKKIAGLGCNILILHDRWQKDHRRIDTYLPRHGEKALRRVIQSAHRLGLRVMVYSRPYPKLLEKGGFFQTYLKRDWDGVYIDHGDPEEFSEYAKVFPQNSPKPDYAFAARQYFLYTKKLRETVGPGGIVIVHTGRAIHGFGHAVVDGYLSGEAQLRMLTSPRAFVEGMFPSAAVSTVWTWRADRRPYLTPKAAAYYAAFGAFPHIVFSHEGVLAPDAKLVDAEQKTCVWPLWQMWRALPFPYTGSRYTDNNAAKVVQCSSKDVRAVVYRASDDLLLVTVGNLGDRPVSGVTLQLNTRKLPMTGRYNLVLMEATDRGLSCRRAGSVSDGNLKAGSFAPYQYKGFLLTRGDPPDYVQTLLKAK